MSQDRKEVGDEPRGCGCGKSLAAKKNTKSKSPYVGGRESREISVADMNADSP